MHKKNIKVKSHTQTERQKVCVRAIWRTLNWDLIGQPNLGILFPHPLREYTMPLEGGGIIVSIVIIHKKKICKSS